MKIAIIIDKSLSYIDFEKDRIIKKWNNDSKDFMIVKSFNEVGESTIFGDSPLAIMYINDVETLKKLSQDIEKCENIQSKLEYGFIICCTISRVSTKKIEKTINDLHGMVIVTKQNSKDKTNISQNMMKNLQLNYEVKNFLESYVGDDYESLIPIIKTIEDLKPQQQEKISIEDMQIRLPQPPGAIPPWEIEKYLMSGDINKMIETYRRIIKHSHYLVVLSLIKGKMIQAWKISSFLNMDNSLSLASLSSKLNVPNNYPFKISYDLAKRIGYDTLTSIVELISDTEGKVKGGSSANPDTIMEITLMQIASRLRK